MVLSSLKQSSALTLLFDAPLDSITMQYHPSTLRMSERTAARNSSGLNNIITYVPPANTGDASINISAYFTALVPERDSDLLGGLTNTDLLIGAGAAAAVSAASLGGRVVLDTLDAAASVVSLAKSVYDISTGLISPKILNPLPVGLADEQFRKIADLSRAMNESVPCQVLWDIALSTKPDTKFVINDMQIDVKNIQEETGSTYIISVDLSLITHGTRVSVI